MVTPQFLDNELFRAVRTGDAAAIARGMSNGRVFDFSDADFRGTDFRHVDLSKIILRGAYLRDADLRGLDMRHMDLEGCSLHNAKIGGTFFPEAILAAEIALSVQYGTRLRVSKN